MEYKSEAKPKALAGGVPVFCAHDEIIAIEKLIPNPKNPNKHPDEQIQLLGRIIRQTGWRQPITVSTRSGFIVKGHGRLMAAQLEGLTEAPVDYQNYASEAEEYADLTADNRIAELSEIDQKMLADIFADIDTGEIPMELTGYTENEVESLVTALSEALHKEELTGEDDIPELEEGSDVVTQRGDLWILGRHRVMCGDSTSEQDREILLGGGSAPDNANGSTLLLRWLPRVQQIGGLDRDKTLRQERERDQSNDRERYAEHPGIPAATTQRSEILLRYRVLLLH